MPTLRSPSAPCFLMELLKERTQRERRPELAVRHDWHRTIARAVDLPIQDGGAAVALVPLLAALAPIAFFARQPFLAARGNELPAIAGHAPGSSLRAMKADPSSTTMSSS